MLEHKELYLVDAHINRFEIVKEEIHELTHENEFVDILLYIHLI